MPEDSDDELKAKAHQAAAKFIALLAPIYNPELSEFGVTQEIYGEIVEALNGYGVEISDWQLPTIAMLKRDKVRIFDIFDMHEPEQSGFESELWANGKAFDPVLRGVLTKSNDSILFTFKGIES